jgi:hypothetical protein
MTLQVNSTRQTQPSKLSWFGERAAGPSDDEPTDKEGRRCYATIAFVIAEGKQREAFKIPMMRVQEWIEINLKAFPLPFYATFGLMAAPPPGPNCGTCGKEHNCEFVTIPEGNIRPQGTYVGSSYQACKYAIRESERCHQIQPNLATFEAAAMHGFVTKKQNEKLGHRKRILSSHQARLTAPHRGSWRLREAGQPEPGGCRGVRRRSRQGARPLGGRGTAKHTIHS